MLECTWSISEITKFSFVEFADNKVAINDTERDAIKPHFSSVDWNDEFWVQGCNNRSANIIGA